MTKKHFEAIARIIRDTYTDDEAGTAALRTAAEEMADYFAMINPNFDRQRFLTACGF